MTEIQFRKQQRKYWGITDELLNRGLEKLDSIKGLETVVAKVKAKCTGLHTYNDSINPDYFLYSEPHIMDAIPFRTKRYEGIAVLQGKETGKDWNRATEKTEYSSWTWSTYHLEAQIWLFYKPILGEGISTFETYEHYLIIKDDPSTRHYLLRIPYGRLIFKRDVDLNVKASEEDCLTVGFKAEGEVYYPEEFNLAKSRGNCELGWGWNSKKIGWENYY